MRKFIVVITIILLSSKLFADDFTPEQKRRVRQVVKEYCDNLTAYCKDVYNVQAQDKILHLVSNRFNKVYDDLNSTYKELEFYQYLKKIQKDYQNGIKISFSPDVNNVDVKGFKERTLARIKLNKTIKAENFNKTVANYFYVNVQNFKILNILDDVAGTENLTPLQLWQKGIELMENNFVTSKKFEKGLNYLKKSANQNFPNAVNSLGLLYAYDDFLNPLYMHYNPKEAEKLFMKAGKLGLTKAYFNLGNLYLGSHKEISKGNIWDDRKEAAKWYLKGAELGDDNCQCAIANYYDSSDKRAERKLAISWWQKAARQGNIEAQLRLRGLGYKW